MKTNLDKIKEMELHDVAELLMKGEFLKELCDQYPRGCKKCSDRGHCRMKIRCWLSAYAREENAE